MVAYISNPKILELEAEQTKVCRPINNKELRKCPVNKVLGKQT